MNAKVMQLAQYIIQPKLFLKSVKFPQLPPSIPVNGLGQAGNVSHFQGKWIFYDLSNLERLKDFDKIKRATIRVEIQLEVGNTLYVDTQNCTVFNSTAKGKS